VNDKHSPLRKRFTIAHELDHYYQYKYGADSLKSVDDTLEKEGIITDFWIERNGNDNQAEREANQIAAEILMLEDIVRSSANSEKTVLQYKTIAEFAKLFGVSETAMAFRLKNLNIYTLDMLI